MYIKKTYDCGRVKWIEKIQPRSYQKKEKRAKRSKATPEQKRQENKRQAERKLARILDANFQEGDWHLVLTYRPEERPNELEAKKRLRKFLAVMRREYRKAGVELKYVAVTEGKKAVHHHIIVNNCKVSVDVIRKAWTYGRPKLTPLDDEGSYITLAEYLIKETDERFRDEFAVEKQRYSRSRNLIEPKPKKQKIRAREFRSQPVAPAGWKIEAGSLYEGISTITGRRYQYYRIIRIKNDRGK